ncbi:hypothetical protein QBC38DRAFT_455961 [Podospora fimiseda]|uniref:Uncharacterized protein n=1 Tax=Podospora fimiseda TaxID=252190 RepID=A0AAN7H1H7_9PEZI|nr:hypothetical protein QBC38DRAFT_455961 [Podospora fimiseda]
MMRNTNQSFFGRNMSDLEEEVRRLQQERRLLKHENQSLTEENWHLKQQISHLENVVAEQNEELEAKNLHHNNSRALDGFKANFSPISTKISDGEIKSNWKSLRFLVRQLVQNYLADPQMRRHMESRLFCPIILESMVWQLLQSHIFASTSPAWGGAAGKHYSQACERLSAVRVPPVVRSVGFIKKTAHDSAALLQHSTTTTDLLMLLMSRENFWGEGDQESQMREAVEEMFHAAAKIDTILRTSKADFKVFFGPIDDNYQFPWRAEISIWILRAWKSLINSPEVAATVQIARSIESG